MATPLHTPKEVLWRDRLERWLQSKLGVRAFCTEHHLSEQSFYFWRRTLAERGLFAWPQESEASSASPAFVPLQLEAEIITSPIEIILTQGRILRVSAGFDAQTLRQVIETLEAVRPC